MHPARLINLSSEWETQCGIVVALMMFMHIILPLSLSLSLSLSLFLSPSLSNNVYATHIILHSHSLFLSLSHSLTHSLSPSLSLPPPLSPSPPPLTHTHTHHSLPKPHIRYLFSLITGCYRREQSIRFWRRRFQRRRRDSVSVYTLWFQLWMPMFICLNYVCVCGTL